SLQKTDEPFTYCLKDIDTGQDIGRSFTIGGLSWPPIPTSEVDDEYLMRVNPADISRDRTRVLMIDADGLAHLIDPATGQAVGPPLEHTVDEAREGIRSVAFSPDGKYVLTRSPRVRALWSAETGAPINQHLNRIGVQVSRFSPGGKLVLAGTSFSSGQ